MNKIILSLIFVFIALMGVASVSACDVDNCTLKTDFNENNVENVVLDEINNTQIADDINNGADNQNDEPQSAINQSGEKHSIDLANDEMENQKLVNEIENQILILKSYIVNEHWVYVPFENISNPSQKLIESVSNQYGTANVSSMASTLGVSEETIVEIISEIKLGYHGQKLKDAFAKTDEDINWKICQYKCLQIGYMNLQDIMELYGLYNTKDMAKKLNITYGEMNCILNQMNYGNFGEKYQKFIIDKNDEMKKQIYLLESYVITKFPKHDIDNYQDLVESRLDNVQELLESVSNQYGTANVSSMASTLGISEGIILEIINEIKLGLHGQELKNLFEQKDKENTDKIKYLDSCIETGNAAHWKCLEGNISEEYLRHFDINQ